MFNESTTNYTRYIYLPFGTFDVVIVFATKMPSLQAMSLS